jgi:hypothetical protein
MTEQVLEIVKLMGFKCTYLKMTTGYKNPYYYCQYKGFNLFCNDKDKYMTCPHFKMKESI